MDQTGTVQLQDQVQSSPRQCTAAPTRWGRSTTDCYTTVYWARVAHTVVVPSVLVSSCRLLDS